MQVALCDSDGNSKCNCHSDIEGNSKCDTNAYCNANSNTKAEPNPESCSYAEISAYARAALIGQLPVSLSDW